MTYFAMVVYLVDVGLTAVPESRIGYALYRLVDFVFLPFSLAGAAVCLIALVIDVKARRWTWFAVVLFLSFFFLSHLWMVVSENIRAMRAE